METVETQPNVTEEVAPRNRGLTVLLVLLGILLALGLLVLWV